MIDPSEWLSDPALLRAGNTIQGFWVDLLLQLGRPPWPSLTIQEVAELGRCREDEVASRLHSLKVLKIAEVLESGDRVQIQPLRTGREGPRS